MGKLVKGFQPRSRGDGVFTAEITFRRGQNELGHKWGFSVTEQKEIFLNEAEKVCDRLDILIGYNETEAGFEVGFEDVSDHAPFMAEIEIRMTERCAQGQLTPETARLLGKELVNTGIWTAHERNDNIRKMTTPSQG